MTRYFPHIGFIIVFLLWGINISSMKIGGQEWDPFIFNGIRYSSLIPVMWAYTFFYYRSKGMRITMEAKDAILIIILGVVSSVGMEAVLSYALQYSNSANGAVLGRGFMPIITAGMALLLRDLRLTPRMIVGIPLALVGVFFIVAGGGLHFGMDTLKGDVLLLMRSFLGALYLIWMNKLVRKYPLPLLVACEMTFGGLAILPYVLWKVDAAYLAAMSTAGWVSLAYTTIFATLIGFSLHNWSLGKLGPFKSSMYGYLMPITAAAAGWWLLGEKISTNQYIGGAIVLFALYLVQKDRMQAAAVKQTSPEPSARRNAAC